jgi:SRSO17 transposase
LELAAEPQKGRSRWLLLACWGSDEPDDLVFYQAYDPEDTSVEKLVRIRQGCWAIESAFEEARGEIRMDHYELRRWDAWHCYVTLCLLAHAFLVVTRLL